MAQDDDLHLQDSPGGDVDDAAYGGRRPLNKGKIVFILTLVFAAALITAVIVLAVRSDNNDVTKTAARECCSC